MNGQKRYLKLYKASFLIIVSLVTVLLVVCVETGLAVAKQLPQEKNTENIKNTQYVPNEAIICVSSQQKQTSNRVVNCSNQKSNNYSIKTKLNKEPLNKAVEEELANGGENIAQVVESEENIKHKTTTQTAPVEVAQLF